MAARKIPRRIVIFLGAGASFPFGYPLTADLLPKIWSGLQTPKGRGSWTRWAGMRGRADAAQLTRLFAALLPGLPDTLKIEGGVSIVDVISLVDQMVAEGRSPDPKISLRELLAARQVLNKAINGVLQGTAKRAYAQRLSEWLLRASTEHNDSRVSVVSTNYDAAVEHALFRRFVRHGISVGRVVDLGMPWRDAFRNQMHVRPPGARLALLKLHGSLSWLRCEVCGHVTVNVTQRIASLDHWESRSPRGYNVCWCKGLLRSILVTPSVVRDVRDANLLGIWRAALEDLRLADEWVFVGYSLPPEDIAIRSVLLRAWHSRRRKALRVRVVQYEEPPDPQEDCGEDTAPELAEAIPPSDVYKRYRLFFPQSALKEANYTRDGFEKYVDGLGSELLQPNELDERLQQFFYGWSADKVRRRERDRLAIAAERTIVRKGRR